MKKLIAFLLTMTFLLQLCACTSQQSARTQNNSIKTVNLTAELTASEPAQLMTMDFDPADAAAEFALSLLQNGYKGGNENMILSPYSVLIALAMTANGADGATLAQMEEVFGLTNEELNTFLYLCRQEEREELITANSIWLRDTGALCVEQSFLQTNIDCFDAQVFKAAFDQQTVEDINAWVREHTKERISELVQELAPDTAMILINALAFDGVWEDPFDANDTYEGVFYAADGTQQTAQMMRSTEYGYLEDGMATGFVKDYENGYSFVALLPKEDVSIEDYVASLTGESLMDAIENAAEENVNVTMPKLETETSLDLRDILAGMGMELAFGAQADFSRMGEGSYSISKVLHKTYLKVDEEGTEAAAATAVFVDKSAPIHLGPSVVLDRPYVMAIMDHETGILLFLGVVNQVND